MAWVNEYEISLPSGNKPKLRRIDLVSLLARKRGIPDVLIPIVERQINPKAKRKFEKPEEVTEATGDELEMSAFLDWLCTKVFVSPRVFEDAVPEGVDGILTEDLAFEDKTHVLGWTIGGEAGLAAMQFRRESRFNVGTPRPSEDVPQAAE